MSAAVNTLPKEFIWRRLHSLMGLWLVLFLMEHLLVNSQAALWIGENGKGFVELVNSIHNLPYLQVIEVLLLGIPILIHMIWGVKYLMTSKANSSRSDGSKPALPEYGRNHAYTWQRITSWILLIGLIGHVVKFRFIDYPSSLEQGGSTYYFVTVDLDNGLYTVADRLGVTLYDAAAVEKEKKVLQDRMPEVALIEAANTLSKDNSGLLDSSKSAPYDPQKALIFNCAQQFQEKIHWVKTLEKMPISKNEVIACAKDFGTASLLSVRDTFKSPIYVVLYTIFVLAACFHAFNGLWTFLITWGVILKMTSQRAMVTFAVGLMGIIIFLGLISIWGTYWLNLKQ